MYNCEKEMAERTNFFCIGKLSPRFAQNGAFWAGNNKSISSTILGMLHAAQFFP
jgi:hypothetical protein